MANLFQVSPEEVGVWESELYEWTDPQDEEQCTQYVYDSVIIISRGEKVYRHERDFGPTENRLAKDVAEKIRKAGAINPTHWIELDEDTINAMFYPYGRTSEEIAQNNYEWELQQGLEGREGYC